MVLLKTKKKFPPFLKRGAVVEKKRLLSCSKKESKEIPFTALKLP
jgi:hypothetical protein